ncbi:MAG: hypothetical protein JXB15_02725, partial [Anaerolineales bacterium]|nr:hypothetical protein [Anaerolineales bacterium]
LMRMRKARWVFRAHFLFDRLSPGGLMLTHKVGFYIQNQLADKTPSGNLCQARLLPAGGSQ